MPPSKRVNFPNGFTPLYDYVNTYWGGGPCKIRNCLSASQHGPEMPVVGNLAKFEPMEPRHWVYYLTQRGAGVSQAGFDLGAIFRARKTRKHLQPHRSDGCPERALTPITDEEPATCIDSKQPFTESDCEVSDMPTMCQTSGIAARIIHAAMDLADERRLELCDIGVEIVHCDREIRSIGDPSAHDWNSERRIPVST